ncbi:AAA family ATPase [Calothrix rhizosoleniae]|uniref:AAA family ATPase n=2 Tax=Calothrix rhizosoleniae TaxID=888997 RepID=UPI0030D966CA
MNINIHPFIFLNKLNRTMLLIPGYEITAKLVERGAKTIYAAIRTCDQQEVILKTIIDSPDTRENIAQITNEYKIIKDLEIESICKYDCLQKIGNLYVLIRPYSPYISLINYLQYRKIGIIDFLNLSINIVNALGEIHQHEIIHNDIKLDNIIINESTQKIKIIDFGIAECPNKKIKSTSNPNVILGTPAYISPERTGRMNRPVDYRTDYYSLGVTFYQILTGKLPFETTDSLELIHSHIAKQPISPQQIMSEIPPVVSDIVMKLMSKNPEDRYQSSFGLITDIKTCLVQLEIFNKINNFSLGQQDISGNFEIPQKLYGRETEIKQLLSAFNRVSKGGKEITLVAGYAGIGKTELINEIKKNIINNNGYFISGKFSQIKQNIPYVGFIEAFQTLIKQLLTINNVEIHEWQQKIINNLGSNARIITDLVPDLEIIIGKQAVVPRLPITESQNRFNLVFEKFVDIFTTQEHPLVIFLDDLHWADSASIELIKLLINSSDIKHLLMIGTYRNYEVNNANSFINILAKTQNKKARLNIINLSPLNKKYIKQLLIDIYKCNSETSYLLAEILYKKTNGNPFFLIQLLKTIYHSKLVIFDYHHRVWQWDIDKIQKMEISDNVIELMVSNIEKLDNETQNILKIAACIGNKFDLDTLSIINNQNRICTGKKLLEAVNTGFILPISDEIMIDNLINNCVSTDEKSLANEKQKSEKIRYKFLHDRVQQAVYSLIPYKNKQKNHWQIGKLLLNQTDYKQIEEKVFDLVNQLNIGYKSSKCQSDKYELAHLNLIAGQKAKAANAYISSLEYLRFGLNLLHVDSWVKNYQLTFELYLENIELEFIQTNINSAFNLSKIAIQKTDNILDKIKLYELQIKFYIYQNEMQKALDIGLQVLDILEVKLSQKINKTLIIEDLLNLPEMSNIHQIVAVDILETITAAAFTSNPGLVEPIIITMINICSQYGNTYSSAYAYGLYGLLLCSSINKIDLGYNFGKLAVNLIEKLDVQQTMSRVYHLVSICIIHWKEHGKKALDLSLKAIEIGLKNGDLEYTSYAAMFYSQNIFLLGINLEQVNSDQCKYINLIRQLKNDFSFYYAKIWRQVTLNLLDSKNNSSCLIGEELNEAELLPYLLEVNNIQSLFSIYLAKTILCYLFGDYQESIKNAKLAENYIEPITTTIGYVNYIFYYSLAILAEYLQSADAKTKSHLNESKNITDIIDDNQKKMNIWAENCPANYQHKYDLIEAEKLRILGQKLLAMEYYELAISGAQETGYIHEEALANERAADFYLSFGRLKIAEVHIKEAYYGYSYWGAKAKVKNLKSKYADLFNKISTIDIIDPNKINYNKNIISNSTRANQIDLKAVIKASQVFTSEIVLDRLLEKMLKIVLENAGAQSCFLLLDVDGNLFLEAYGQINPDNGNIEVSVCSEKQFILPLSIINYVYRSEQDVVLENATSEGIFSHDIYIASRKPKSILCTAIIYQGKSIGILYLENNIVTGAFSSDRLEILKILSSQAAISIENARLYKQMTSLNNSLTQQIKERIQAQNALSSSEQRFSQFLEAVPVGIFVTDSKGQPYYANQIAQQILGKGIVSDISLDKLSDVYRPYVLDTRDFYPYEKQPIVMALQGKTVSIDDMEIHHGDRVIPLEVAATPIFDQNGEIIYAIAVFQDITERKQAEAQRIKFTKQLSQKNIALEKAATELEYSNINLEKKVEERTQKLSETLEILKATQSDLLIENALLRSGDKISKYEYQVGGSLPMDAPTYVVRSADRYLYKSLKTGHFCYVLNTRQMGKSSLRVQIMKRLQAEGFVCAAIDISEIGNRYVTIEQWYVGFIYILANNLNLLETIDIRKWWRDHDMLSPVQRLGEFLHQILLKSISEKIIIFIDEIDNTINLDFDIDDFFILIRNCYNQRASNVEYNRLNFVLFGVGTSSQFIQDKNRTPFNIGNAIPLQGFKLHEAQPLLQGLQEKVRNPQIVLKEVLGWTNGQPFLTQKICKLIRSSPSCIPTNSEAEWIENLIQTQIIENWESQDEPEHLRTIRDRLCHNSSQNHLPNQKLEVVKLWQIYQRILLEGNIIKVESREVRELLLSGLVIQEQGMLKVNNRIYELIFDLAWVKMMLAEE